jgi:hypothetical protein
MSRHQRCSFIWRFFVAQFNMQADYSWFLSAFAFLALGVISLLRKQRAFSRLPWQWLEMFAVLSGYSCLRTLVAHGLGQASPFPALNLMLDHVPGGTLSHHGPVLA